MTRTNLPLDDSLQSGTSQVGLKTLYSIRFIWKNPECLNEVIDVSTQKTTLRARRDGKSSRMIPTGGWRSSNYCR